jgi:hypothetical protein
MSSAHPQRRCLYKGNSIDTWEQFVDIPFANQSSWQLSINKKSTVPRHRQRELRSNVKLLCGPSH